MTGAKINGRKKIGPTTTGVLNKTGLPIENAIGTNDVPLIVPPRPDPVKSKKTKVKMNADLALFTPTMQLRAPTVKMRHVRPFVRRSVRPVLIPADLTVVMVGVMTEGFRILMN